MIPIYKTNIILGGRRQTTQFKLLPDELISRQSGQAEVYCYHEDQTPFDVSGATASLQATPFGIDVDPVTLFDALTTDTRFTPEITYLFTGTTAGLTQSLTLVVNGEDITIPAAASATDVAALINAHANLTNWTVELMNGSLLDRPKTRMKITSNSDVAVTDGISIVTNVADTDNVGIDVIQEPTSVRNLITHTWNANVIPAAWSSYQDYEGPIAVSLSINATNEFFQCYQRISIRDTDFVGDGANMPDSGFRYLFTDGIASSWAPFGLTAQPEGMGDAINTLVEGGKNDWGKIISVTINAPATPVAGGRYLVGSQATIVADSWGTGITVSEHDIVTRNTAGSAWVIKTPSRGDFAFNTVTNTTIEWDGTIWGESSSLSSTDELDEGSTNLYYTTARAATDRNADTTVTADRTKLGTIATNATANSTDAQLRDRSTHTGTQAIETISGLGALGLSTGAIDFVGLSATVGTTSFSIGQVDGWFVNPPTGGDTTPIATRVVRSPTSSHAISSGLLSYVSVDEAGTVYITDENSPWTEAQRRSRILLGTVVHTGGIITEVNNRPNIAMSTVARLETLAGSIGAFNETGNTFSAGSGIKLAKTLGVIYAHSANYGQGLDGTTISPLAHGHSPDRRQMAASATQGFYYGSSNIDAPNSGITSGASFAPITDLRFNEWDDKTTKAPTDPALVVPNGSWTIQRIYMFSQGAVLITRGQAIYASIGDARAAITTEDVTLNPIITDLSVHMAYMLVGASATPSAGDIEFIPVSRFGGGGGAGGGGGIAEPIAGLTFESPATTPVSGDLTGTETRLYIDQTSGRINQLLPSGASVDLTASAAGVNINLPNQFKRQQNFSNGDITYSTNIDWDVDEKQVTRVVLTGASARLENPTNTVANGTYILKVVQDATGSRALTFADKYKFPSNQGTSVSSTANSVTVMTFIEEAGFLLASDVKNYLL